MDKIELLKKRKAELFESGKKIREIIAELTDEKSFVEQSTFSFSEGELYEGAQGEGVVCGFATIDNSPYYIVAQNFEVLSGGISKAGCDKILRCLNAAEVSDTPVIFILNSRGIRIGEGVTALEGISAVIAKSVALKGAALQYAIVVGELYGVAAVLAANADFTFMYEDSTLAHASPFVLSAKVGKNLSPKEAAGADALKDSGLVSFKAKNTAEIKQTIMKITDLIVPYGEEIKDYSNLNKTFPPLNKGQNAKLIIDSVFDENSHIEIFPDFCPQIKCVLGRIGGIAAAAAVFETGDNKVDIKGMKKLADFVEFAGCFGLNLITFVNSTGLDDSLNTLYDFTLKETARFSFNMSIYNNVKISVIYGKATGAGYALFAAKSVGYDYSFAFADAKIALFDSAAGAEVEFQAKNAEQKAKLTKRYADENSDAINAAKCGYIDNIIEPALVKQYLIATLQMLMR